MTDQNNWAEFMRFVPGFDFLKNLASPAVGGASAGAASTASGAFQQWLAPTMDEGEIQKRIDELKVVQFWLEQNTRALEASIHALEVQKSTVATLKSMNAGMQHMSQTFADSMAHSAQRTASAFEQDFGAASAPATPDTAAAQPPKPGADEAAQAPLPMPDVPLMQAQAAQWWTALTEQFQTIASKAMQDIGNNVAAMQQEPFSARAAAAEPGAEQATPTAAAGSQTSKRAAGASPKARTSTAAAKTNSKPKSSPK
ncbi:hypothetical protein E8K88_07130 [Lampropedia aestuarii]|uniref:Uncharacterized protein n=1 Tax=Lampropedia aestuarii TaxID=2562762 RepID=A0A4S5BWG2_9BURK|nr:PhaM family polyhydroxyalkanoate granule multifunctional regulatory protein [Lampropedia aestuarii]THJ34286.1 hypothetical protein E8K88_07130 [Lampropedia aestuarii]